MQCPKCRTTNEAGSRFCGGCGADLTLTATARPASGPTGARIYCQRCGTANPADSRFCEGCGNTMVAEAPVSPAKTVKEKPSGAWWLLPIFFAWLGGLIAWAVVRDSDAGRARKMLAVGFIVTFAWIGLSFLFSALVAGLNWADFGLS